jgi:hypothetical protein
MIGMDNGILARVPGQFVALGAEQLPDPEAAQAGEQSVELDADYAGRVRITYDRTLAQHGKSRHWYWRAVRADAA